MPSASAGVMAVRESLEAGPVARNILRCLACLSTAVEGNGTDFHAKQVARGKKPPEQHTWSEVHLSEPNCTQSLEQGNAAILQAFQNVPIHLAHTTSRGLNDSSGEEEGRVVQKRSKEDGDSGRGESDQNMNDENVDEAMTCGSHSGVDESDLEENDTERSDVGVIAHTSHPSARLGVNGAEDKDMVDDDESKGGSVSSVYTPTGIPILDEIFAACLQGDDGHVARLELITALLEMQFVKDRPDIRACIVSILCYDLSSRWALAGWSLWARGRLNWDECPLLEDLNPTDRADIKTSEGLTVVQTALTPKQAWTELDAGLKCLWAAVRAQDRIERQFPGWVDAKNIKAPDYYTELWQLIAIVIIQFNVDKGRLKSSKHRVMKDKGHKNKHHEILPDETSAYETAVKLATVYLDYYESAHSPEIAHIYYHWLLPAQMVVCTQLGRCDSILKPAKDDGAISAHTCAALAKHTSKCLKLPLAERAESIFSSTRYHPLSSLNRVGGHVGIVTYRGIFVDIEDPDFFGKAKQLGISGQNKHIHDELRGRRAVRRQHRAMAKEINKEASVVERLVLQDQQRHHQKLARERKRIARVLEQDDTELRKMKTYGGSMDTSVAPYRAKKKQKIAKGRSR